MKKICMLGAGAWGTAISSVLADNGYSVNLWCYDPTVASTITEENCNKLYSSDNFWY